MAERGSGGSLLLRADGRSNLKNARQAAITASPGAGGAGREGEDGCEPPARRSPGTAALAAMPALSNSWSLMDFSDSAGNCRGLFQQRLAPGSFGSSAAWLAFRSTNGARRFLAVRPHDMAQTPRSFSKQDGAFPSYLNLVENLSALTLLLQMPLWGYTGNEPQTEGEHWGWGEKNEMFCRPWCREALPKLPVLGACPPPGWGTSSRTTLQGGLWAELGDAGGTWWEFPGARRVCGLCACRGRWVWKRWSTMCPSNLSHDPPRPCPQRMGPVIPEQQSKEQPAPVAASSKKKWDTSC